MENNSLNLLTFHWLLSAWESTFFPAVLKSHCFNINPLKAHRGQRCWGREGVRKRWQEDFPICIPKELGQPFTEPNLRMHWVTKKIRMSSTCSVLSSVVMNAHLRRPVRNGEFLRVGNFVGLEYVCPESSSSPETRYEFQDLWGPWSSSGFIDVVIIKMLLAVSWRTLKSN